MTELGIYTRYSSLGASSRLRYLRYAELLAGRKFAVGTHALLPDGYLERLYSGRSANIMAACAVLKRLGALPRAEKNLWIEYELLPRFPFGVEKSFLRDRRYVLNFDDALYVNYRGRRFLDGKYERLAAASSGVMVANDVLWEHFSRFNPRTVKIPTAVDTESLTPSDDKFPRFTVAWIGTPVTFAAHLAPFLPTLDAIRKRVEFELLAIGGAERAEVNFDWLRIVPWSESAECGMLPKCHVGIMPLPEHDEFASGKSAYKLLQYLAAGIPCVASPVGENRVAVRPGVTGFLASSAGEWEEALRTLAADTACAGRLSANARCESEKYSVKRWFPVIADFLEKSFSGA